jgi:hypothetical protein
MLRPLYSLAILCLASLPLVSQQSSIGTSVSPPSVTAPARSTLPALKPFSHLALGGGIGIMGINLQAATNINRYSNLRVTGNIFNYTVDNITSNGFTGTGKLGLATLGASFDLYPWPRHGFRLSPGLLLYNQNSLTATAIVNAGESFTLNNTNYYSSAADPIHANARLGLNSTNPAFTITTGWGNMISRKGGHWSFPFEIGAAFVGSPAFNMTLSGTACDSTGLNCANAATNPDIQSNLQAQIDKYQKDLEPLKVFPVLSIGISYNFNLLGPR